ncbi:MAG TPA: hypothetical protein VN238_03725 [Solirubrobacteraceae bacterium]|nr:hypothetical protein [Solirubrobacteraceae bacterium]
MTPEEARIVYGPVLEAASSGGDVPAVERLWTAFAQFITRPVPVSSVHTDLVHYETGPAFREPGTLLTFSRRVSEDEFSGPWMFIAEVRTPRDLLTEHPSSSLWTDLTGRPTVLPDVDEWVEKVADDAVFRRALSEPAARIVAEAYHS